MMLVCPREHVASAGVSHEDMPACRQGDMCDGGGGSGMVGAGGGCGQGQRVAMGAMGACWRAFSLSH